MSTGCSGCEPCVLAFQKIKMIGRPCSMTDRQTMSDGFGQIGLGGLHGVVDGLTTRQMRGNGRGEGTSCAMRVRRINIFAFEDAEEPAVVEEVRRAFGEQVPALDQDVFTAESMNDLSSAACIGERLDFDAGELLSLVDVWGDEQR